MDEIWRRQLAPRYRFDQSMFERRCRVISAAFLLSSASCSLSHSAPVRSAALPPPPDPVVHHAARVWVELVRGVLPSQCVHPKGNRDLCFEDVDAALGESLQRALWTTFPGVEVLSYGDAMAAGDYLLEIELRLNAVSPHEQGPGWAARGQGRWRLLRDGLPLAGESVEAQSRADFAYGSALGVGAGEVVSALAVHIGMTLGGVPETAPHLPSPLPPVYARSLAGAGASVARR